MSEVSSARAYAIDTGPMPGHGDDLGETANQPPLLQVVEGGLLTRHVTDTNPTVLSPGQAVALDYTSQGYTNNQAARAMDIEPRKHRRLLVLASRRLGGTTLSATTHAAISTGEINVVRAEEDETLSQLTPIDLRTIMFYANGGRNIHISKATGMNIKTVERYSDDLQERIKAWSPAHLIRRAHEIGVLAAREAGELQV